MVRSKHSKQYVPEKTTGKVTKVTKGVWPGPPRSHEEVKAKEVGRSVEEWHLGGKDGKALLALAEKKLGWTGKRMGLRGSTRERRKATLLPANRDERSTSKGDPNYWCTNLTRPRGLRRNSQRAKAARGAWKENNASLRSLRCLCCAQAASEQ